MVTIEDVLTPPERARLKRRAKVLAAVDELKEKQPELNAWTIAETVAKDLVDDGENAWTIYSLMRQFNRR